MNCSSLLPVQPRPRGHRLDLDWRLARHFAQLADRVIDLHRSEEHTSELQSLMRNSYAVFCLKKKNYTAPTNNEREPIYPPNIHSNLANLNHTQTTTTTHT